MPEPKMGDAMRVAMYKWLRSMGSRGEREDADAYRRQTAAISEGMAEHERDSDRYLPPLKHAQHAGYLLQGASPRLVREDPHAPSHFAEGATRVTNAGAAAARDRFNNMAARMRGGATVEADDGQPLDYEQMDPSIRELTRQMQSGEFVDKKKKGQ